MTPAEREALLDECARKIGGDDAADWVKLHPEDREAYVDAALAALEFLEPRIREDEGAKGYDAAGAVVDAIFEAPTWLDAKVDAYLVRAKVEGVPIFRALMLSIGIAVSRECARVAKEKGASPEVCRDVLWVGNTRARA